MTTIGLRLIQEVWLLNVFTIVSNVLQSEIWFIRLMRSFFHGGYKFLA
jgi:hypothetical protein